MNKSLSFDYLNSACQVYYLPLEVFTRRLLNGNSLLDKIPTTKIFKDLNIPSVNQINAQTKLLQVWKSQQSETFPIQWVRRNEAIQDRRTRASKENLVTEYVGGHTLMATFISDAARVWNLAPESIKNCTSLLMAKKRIKEFSLTLPI